MQRRAASTTRARSVDTKGVCTIFQFDEFSMFWEEVVPCPDRENWLPAVSYYEQKGLDEGRSTMLQCWQCL